MSTKKPNLNILKSLLWNANGLKQHETELLHLLLEKQIDIALITETHCKPNTKFFFPGFKIFRTDHPDKTAHAGTAIIISSKIQHQLLPSVQLPTIQSTTIQITLNHVPTKISSVYLPPHPAISSRQLNQFLKSLGQQFLVGGDFNAKHSQWGCISDNQRGKMLQNITKNTPYIFISPKGPTYWPQHHNRHPDILDFFLSSLPRHIKHSVNNLNDLSSDHTPILLTTIASIEPTPPHPSLSQGPIKWDEFSEIMQNTTYLNISLKNKDDIESAAQNLVTSIQSAIFKSSHPITQSSKHNTSNPYLPINITNLISEKRRVRSRWQKYHYPSDKKLYNHLANTIKKLILKNKSEFFENKFQSLNQTDGSLWKTTKNLLRIKEQLPPITDSDGSLAISDIEKANLFGKHLSKIFIPHADIIPNSDHSETIEQFINSPLPMSLPAKHTSPSEILFLIKKLKDGKSPGHDLITNKVLKNLPRKPILLITFIFNAMLRLSYFPLIWKLSTVILIPKPNKPKTLATSYRPISLLPTLAKLFEKIILKRIRPIMQTHKIIPNSQFGFRAKHSSVHQIHRLTDKISSSFEMKKFCPGVFLDVAQAFDRVWHDGLLYKLKLFLPAPYYLIIRSYLENRSYKIRYGSSYSPHFSIKAGVPQGSDLSPDLFNIYTADIPFTTNTTLATYADDTAILCANYDPDETSNCLQAHLDSIDNWATKWRIKINPDKSVYVPFTLKRTEPPPVHFQGTQIPSSPNVKYLGITIDKRLTWGPHLKQKRKTLNSRLHLLRPILKSKLPVYTKLILYKSLLRPIWAYAIQIWGCAKPSQIRTIQAFQSITLRMITSAPWFVSNSSLHSDLKIESVDQLAKKHYRSFYSKLPSHTNPLVSQISSTHPINPIHRLKRKYCRDLLI